MRLRLTKLSRTRGNVGSVAVLKQTRPCEALAARFFTRLTIVGIVLTRDKVHLINRAAREHQSELCCSIRVATTNILFEHATRGKREHRAEACYGMDSQPTRKTKCAIRCTITHTRLVDGETATREIGCDRCPPMRTLSWPPGGDDAISRICDALLRVTLFVAANDWNAERTKQRNGMCQEVRCAP